MSFYFARRPVPCCFYPTNGVLPRQYTGAFVCIPRCMWIRSCRIGSLYISPSLSFENYIVVFNLARDRHRWRGF